MVRTHSILEIRLQSRPTILSRKLSNVNAAAPGVGVPAGGRVVGGFTSVVRSGARRTVKSAVLFDVASSNGPVVSTRIALTNSRLASGLPIKIDADGRAA